MERKYYIGIDFGHGETTVSRVPGYGSDKVSQMKIRRTSDEKSKKVISAICKRNEKWSLVYGEDDFSSKEIREGFKDRVSRMSDTDKESFERFARLIFAEILANDDQLVYKSYEERNFELWIACPSGWTLSDPEAAKEYLEFFRNRCGLPVDGCIKESDAAFFSKFEEYEDYNSVFVIDLGSSTVDYTTYSNSRIISEGCWGECLGAHQIEDILIDYILSTKKHTDALKEIDQLRKNNNWKGDIKHAMSLYARLHKERHYINNTSGINFPIFYKDLYPFLDDSKLFQPVVACIISEENYCNLISSYCNQLLESFRNAALKLQRHDITPDRIILSGGASQMPFVKKYVESVFGNIVDRDNTPECVVSSGLALYAKRLDECKTAMMKKFRAVDFRSLYIESDKKAMKSSAEALLTSTLNNIKTGDNCKNGHDMRNAVCSFFRSLDESNQKFADNFKHSLRVGLSQKIKTAIEETIQEEFHVKIEAHSKISVKDIPILSTPPSLFRPGGQMYNLIGTWIEKSYAATFGFNWDKERSWDERIKIATGLQKYISAFIISDHFLTYGDLSPIIEYITSQAEEQLLKSFETNQVFETTYKNKTKE